MKKTVKKHCKAFKKYILRHRSSFAVIATAFAMTVCVNVTYGEVSSTYENRSGLSRAVSANFFNTAASGAHIGISAAEPEVSAQSAIVINGNTGEILYEKNSGLKAYPASTTKIMTTLIALETLEALQSPIEQTVKVPYEAAGVEGSSIYLEAGEEISFEDLLYGMMLRSGNDAAAATALIISGSIESFVELMNTRAVKIGCLNTHFTNPSGLFDDEHYTTAYDMALISMEAMKNKSFRDIASAKEYTAGRAPGKYNYFYNKNKTVHQYYGGNGIKIGYTKSSGRTLAASAERDGLMLICIVMNASNWFNDAYRLMDYCFEKAQK